MTHNIKVLSLLETLLGQSKKLNKGEVSFHCPACHHRKPKLQVNIDQNHKSFGKWNCWVCGNTNNVKGTNLFSLFKRFNAPPELVSELKEIVGEKRVYNVYTNEEAPKIVALPKEYNPLWQDNTSIYSRHAIAHLKRRGFTEDDIIRYGIGYCEDGRYRERIIIPSFDNNGRVNYFVARAIFDTNPMKYLNPAIEKNVIMFEIFLNFNMDITIVEGVFDAMKVRYNATPILGKDIQDSLMEKLIEHKPAVNIYLDPDAQEASVNLIESLINYGIDVYLVDGEKDKDPADMTTYENKLRIQNRRKADMKDFIKARML